MNDPSTKNAKAEQQRNQYKQRLEHIERRRCAFGFAQLCDDHLWQRCCAEDTEHEQRAIAFKVVDRLRA